MDLVGRLGGKLYSRTISDSKFIVKRPGLKAGIGVDALPEMVRNSSILTGNDIGKLGSLYMFPSHDEITEIKNTPEIKAVLMDLGFNTSALHHYAKKLIMEDRIFEALVILI